MKCACTLRFGTPATSSESAELSCACPIFRCEKFTEPTRYAAREQPCRIFTFVKHVSFEQSIGIPCPVVSSGREGNINKQTELKSFLTLDHRSVSPHRPACVQALRGQWRSGWRRDVDFLSNRKYRYRPYTQPDVGNCWPWGHSLCCGFPHLATKRPPTPRSRAALVG